jgi:hypothetical protein
LMKDCVYETAQCLGYSAEYPTNIDTHL